MSQGVASTAGRRQFNETAINKLMAEGVSRAVATAFVNQGIDKSGRYPQLRDHVCKMEYVQYLLPRTVSDYKDPLRVGQLSPFVQELNMPRFFTEFAMSDIEAAKFAACFPEFNVISRGKTYNQHAFYANKRYAEAELLVGLVYEHARRHGGRFDPKKLVDLGGNDVWHTKRDRHTVHCDNPVLSARDVARYRVREVFSGSGAVGGVPVRSGVSAQGVTVCRKTFFDCTHEADYGMAVHSTYDTTPRSVAMGMHKRKMKCFFFCMLAVPGLEKRADGQYTVDGLVITVARDLSKGTTFSYTFSHDPALEYKHGLSTLQAYMYARRTYDLTLRDGSVVSYFYSIHSMRADTLVGKIERIDGLTLPVPDSLWTPPRRRCYYLSIPWLDTVDLELDTELFDRLVLQATGSRAEDRYDIVALYRYAKSLRQRVSINGVVLSSGYTMDPGSLVAAVVGAYAIAASYRVEGSGFFRRASSQIINRRSQGFLRDVFRVVGASLVAPFGLLASVLAHYSFYNVADAKLKQMISDSAPVTVSIDKPHGAAGYGFNPALLLPAPKLTVDGKFALEITGETQFFTPLLGGYSARLVPQEVLCAGVRHVFLSYGIPTLGKYDMPMDSKPRYYTVAVYPTDTPVKSEEFRAKAYRAVMPHIVNPTAFDSRPIVLVNGDRLFRKRMFSFVDEPALSDTPYMVKDTDVYVAFRGVGTKAVVLTKPPMYNKGTCLAFVLLYEDEVSGKVQALKARRMVGISDPDVAAAVNKLCVDAGYNVTGLVVAAPVELPGEERSELDEFSSGWEGIEDGYEDSTRVGTQDSRDVPYMTGARVSTTPVPSIVEPGTPVITPSTPPGLVGRIVPSSVEGLPGLEHNVGRLDELHGEDGFGSTGAGLPGVSAGVVPAFGGTPPPSVGEPSNEPGGHPLGSESSGGVSSGEVVWGCEAMREQLLVCEAAERVALSTGRQLVNLLLMASRGQAPLAVWGSAVQGVPGGPVPVRVTGDKYVNYLNDMELEHMAVTDGDVVYDRVTRKPPDGLYVSSDIMRVYTGAAIKEAIASALTEPYRCVVTNVDGVAGSGKTYTIVHEARLGDVVLCETSGALRETREKLAAANSTWNGAAYTVDSYLMHRQVAGCNTLWLDESLRLHAAKVFAVIKLLKPKRVYCFGDSKQIAALPFVPDIDFRYHVFPFTSVKRVRDTRRSPADVCLITSQSHYYGFEVRTYNTIRRSVRPIRVFEQGMFQALSPDVQLIVYTQVVKHDLLAQGVKNVITIGESQGNTRDHVMLYRDSTLGKALYYDSEQALVAMTRHRRSFEYVTVAVSDDSRVARDLAWLFRTQTELLLASRVLAGAGASIITPSVPLDDGEVIVQDEDEPSDIENVEELGVV